MTEKDLVAFTQVIDSPAIFTGDPHPVFWTTAKAELEIHAIKTFFAKPVGFVHAEWPVSFHYLL